MNNKDYITTTNHGAMVCFHPDCSDPEHNHDVDYGRGGNPMTLPFLIKCLSETTETIMIDRSGGRIM